MNDEKFLNYLFEQFKGIPRKAPGSDLLTKKALSYILTKQSDLKVADIGCGSGNQTLELARNIKGEIVAIDISQDFLDEIIIKANKESLSGNIVTKRCSMDNLEPIFDDSKLDIIWSEGAIYIMGFETGLNYWKKFLKDDGYLVVSEVAWFKDYPPKEVKDFWNEGYPSISTRKENIDTIEKCGYELIHSFDLPESAWWYEMYSPLEERLKLLRKSRKDDLEFIEALNATQYEIDLYRKYSEYYGYVFYIMKKKS